MINQDFKLTSQSNSWERIGKLAKDKDVIFKNVFQHFNVENLRQAYAAIDGTKAVGIDRITKDQYGENLETNLQELLRRLHVGSYRPQAKRGVEIPKANRKMRLIAVGSFEDKLVEWVLAQILNQIYEPLFIETSYGFKPACVIIPTSRSLEIKLRSRLSLILFSNILIIFRCETVSKNPLISMSTTYFLFFLKSELYVVFTA